MAYAGVRILVLFGQEAEARGLTADAESLFSELAFAAVQLGEYEMALALARRDGRN